MIKNVLSDIGGVGIYGVISISLFFAVFLVALVRTCLLNKAHVERVSELPLDDGLPVGPGGKRPVVSGQSSVVRRDAARGAGLERQTRNVGRRTADFECCGETNQLPVKP